MSKLITDVVATRTATGVVFHRQSFELDELNAEQVGVLTEMMQNVAEFAKTLQGGSGTLSVRLSGTLDGVSVPEVTVTGVSGKELLRLQRKMHHEQDRVLRYAEGKA